jgi:hypothetical protein
LHDAHRRERAETGADARTTDADVDRKLAFRRETVAGLELTLIDQAADVRDHQLRGDTIKGARL